MLTNKPYWKSHGFSPHPEWVEGLPDEVDVLIVGAGAAGLWTGIELANLGRKCYIIDVGIPGARSSSKSDGNIFLGSLESNYYDVMHKQISLSLENKNILEKFIKNFSTNYSWCEYTSYGGVRIASNSEQAKDLENIVEIYRELGICATMLSEQSFRNIANIRYDHGALFIPQESMMNPQTFINGLVNANRTFGNDVISGASMFTYETLPNGKVLVADIYGNVVQANALVLCLNAFSKHVKDAFLNEYIEPTRVQYIASKPFPIEKISSIPPYAFSINNGEEYFRTHNNRVILGGGNEQEGAPPKEYGIMADFKINQYITNTLVGRMAFHLDFVRKEELVPDFIWTRNVATTKDGMPIIGEIPYSKNVFVNTGYGAHGISYLLLGGNMTAKLVCGNQPDCYGSDLMMINRLLRD